MYFPAVAVDDRNIEHSPCLPTKMELPFAAVNGSHGLNQHVPISYVKLFKQLWEWVSLEEDKINKLRLGCFVVCKIDSKIV